MTAGVVNSAYEAVVPLSLQSPAGQSREIETVVDTGFTGYLTLPPALVRDLPLPYVTGGWATLADGSEVSLDTYKVTVLWEGQLNDAFADEADTTPLVGMLMDGCDLSIQVRNGGRVVLEFLVMCIRQAREPTPLHSRVVAGLRVVNPGCQDPSRPASTCRAQVRA